MTNEIHLLTPAGRIKKPSYSLVCSWVKAAWEDIDTNLICRAFKCCGIATKTDGSEDDMIFDYDSLFTEDGKENHNSDELLDDQNNEFFDELNHNNWEGLNLYNEGEIEFHDNSNIA